MTDAPTPGSPLGFSLELIKNIIGNYSYMAITGLIFLILYPIYRENLGELEWGLVSIILLFQALLLIFEGGMSQIMPRDIARAALLPDGYYEVFLAYKKVYFILGCGALLVGLALSPFSSFIIGMTGEESDALVISFITVLVALQAFFNINNNVNIGLMSGLKLQFQSSFYLSVGVIIKHALALTLSIKLNHGAVGFVLGILIVSILEFIFMSGVSSKLVNRSVQNTGGDHRKTRQIFKEATSLTLGVIIGMLVTNIDKIFMASYLTLIDFGRYTLITVLASMMMNAQYPLLKAFLPGLAQTKNKMDEIKQRGKLTILVGLFVLFPCLLVGVFSDAVLFLWIRDSDFANDASLALSILMLAVAINAIYNVFIYQKLILSNRFDIILKLNLISLSLCMLLVVSIPSGLGLDAGGAVMLCNSLSQLMIGYLLMKKTNKYFSGTTNTWKI